MREAFYREFSVKGYEDLEIDEIDTALAGAGLLKDTTAVPDPSTVELVADAAQSVDVLGVLSLVNPWEWAESLGLAEDEVYGEKRFEDPTAFAKLDRVIPKTDAVVLGNSEEYGWFLRHPLLVHPGRRRAAHARR